MKATSNRPGSFWTAERDEDLRRLWAAGWTCSQIASRMKAKSRNAVIGRARRLNLSARAPAGNMSAIGRAGNVMRKALQKPKKISHPWRVEPKPLSPAAQVLKDIKRDGLPLPTPAETDIPRIATVDLEEEHCRFPCVEDVRGLSIEAPIFCGAKRVHGTSYCAPHLLRATNTSNPQRPIRVSPRELQVA